MYKIYLQYEQGEPLLMRHEVEINYADSTASSISRLNPTGTVVVKHTHDPDWELRYQKGVQIHAQAR